MMNGRWDIFHTFIKSNHNLHNSNCYECENVFVCSENNAFGATSSHHPSQPVPVSGFCSCVEFLLSGAHTHTSLRQQCAIKTNGWFIKEFRIVVYHATSHISGHKMETVCSCAVPCSVYYDVVYVSSPTTRTYFYRWYCLKFTMSVWDVANDAIYYLFRGTILDFDVLFAAFFFLTIYFHVQKCCPNQC